MRLLSEAEADVLELSLAEADCCWEASVLVSAESLRFSLSCWLAEAEIESLSEADWLN